MKKRGEKRARRGADKKREASGKNERDRREQECVGNLKAEEEMNRRGQE